MGRTGTARRSHRGRDRGGDACHGAGKSPGGSRLRAAVAAGAGSCGRPSAGGARGCGAGLRRRPGRPRAAQERGRHHFAGAGGVLPADEDGSARAAPGKVRARPADPAAPAGTRDGHAPGGAVRGDARAPAADRRRRGRVGRAAPVRTRSGRGNRAGKGGRVARSSADRGPGGVAVPRAAAGTAGGGIGVRVRSHGSRAE